MDNTGRQNLQEGMAKHGGYIEFKKSLVGFSVLYVSQGFDIKFGGATCPKGYIWFFGFMGKTKDGRDIARPI